MAALLLMLPGSALAQTTFMTGGASGNLPIILGVQYGSGYIMYSGLTTSQFNDSGPGLVDNVIFTTAAGASGANVLVSESPWGNDTDASNMTDVFGGSWSEVTSYASADPSTVFSASNGFVFLEGGDGTSGDWANYIAANSGAILAWVSNGGHLLDMSAGWDPGSFPLGPYALVQDNYVNETSCGNLTAAGVSAFTFGGGTPSNQCGGYLAHDYVHTPEPSAFLLLSLGLLSLTAGGLWRKAHTVVSFN